MEQTRSENGSYQSNHAVLTKANETESVTDDIFSTLIPTVFANNILNSTYTESNNFWDFSRETSIYIYSTITVATIVFTLVRSFTFFTVCMRASIKLHDRMFASITNATMRFFNTNTSGRILNRFSKDMGAIDELLPAAMIDCLQIGLALIGIIVVVGVVNPWLMIPTLLIGIIFYFLRIFYLTTSRSVKRLEGVSKFTTAKQF